MDDKVGVEDFFRNEIEKHPPFLRFGPKSKIFAMVFMSGLLLGLIILSGKVINKWYYLIAIAIVFLFVTFGITMHYKNIPEVLFVPTIIVPPIIMLMALIAGSTPFIIYASVFMFFNVWLIWSLINLSNARKEAERKSVMVKNYEMLKEKRRGDLDFPKENLNYSVDFSKMMTDDSDIKKKSV